MVSYDRLFYHTMVLSAVIVVSIAKPYFITIVHKHSLWVATTITCSQVALVDHHHHELIGFKLAWWLSGHLATIGVAGHPAKGWI